MTWHWAKSAARARRAKHIPAFVLCTRSQLTARPGRRALISQLNLCLLFFLGREKSCVLYSSDDFLTITWCFPHKRVNCPKWACHSAAPLFLASITHYRDVTNPRLAMFCVIFSSPEIKQMLRLYNPNCRATQDWKRDGHLVAREGKKKALGTSSEE